MTGDLPQPLTSPDCDCTDLDGFMLNVERLMASELVALSSHEIVGAALFLWCRAWKQRPAASLPDDDLVNAAFARLPVAKFRRLKDQVLRGFVKCSDGRLYHSTLAAEAVKAFERKQAFQRKRAVDGERLKKWRDTRSETRVETQTETANETHYETRFVAEGQGQGQGQVRDREEKKKEPSLRSEPVRAKKTLIDLPDWIPEKPWLAFLEMRRKKRAFPTESAAQLIVEKLAAFRSQGHEPATVLNESTANNWTGVFEPKNKGHANGTNASNGNGKSHNGGASRAHQNHLEGLAQLVDEADRRSEGIPESGQLALQPPIAR